MKYDEIDKIFDEFSNYIFSFRRGSAFKSLEIILKTSWVLNEDLGEGIKFKEKTRKSNRVIGSFYTEDPNITFDDLINSLKREIGINVEIELKNALLATKMEELNHLFSNLPYEELKDLNFTTETKMDHEMVHDSEIDSD